MAWPYATARWRAMREEQLARMPVCELCGDYRNLEVHHIDEITEGQRRERDEAAAYPALDRLQTLCESCHSMLTKGVPEAERIIRAEWHNFLRGETC